MEKNCLEKSKIVRITYSDWVKWKRVALQWMYIPWKPFTWPFKERKRRKIFFLYKYKTKQQKIEIERKSTFKVSHLNCVCMRFTRETLLIFNWGWCSQVETTTRLNELTTKKKREPKHHRHHYCRHHWQNW